MPRRARAPRFAPHDLPWVDRPSFERTARARVARGELSAREVRLLRAWRRDGYVILRRAIPEDLIDALWADHERAWRERPELRVSAEGVGTAPFWIVPERDRIPRGHYRLSDFHNLSEAGGRIALHPRLTRFFETVFDDIPVAEQTLTFERGTEQDLHQDYVYVNRSRILPHLGAAWVACERIGPRQGPLILYPGSHRWPKFPFAGGRLLPPRREKPGGYLAHMAREARRRRARRVPFLADKGDVIFWHAALLHGGAPVEDLGSTRRSFAIHYASLAAYPCDLRRAPDRPGRARYGAGGLYYEWEQPGHRESRYPLPSGRPGAKRSRRPAFDPATLPWTDRPGFPRELRERRARGEVTRREAALLRRWSRDGYVVLRGVVPRPAIRALWRDYERAWRLRLPLPLDAEILGRTTIAQAPPRRYMPTARHRVHDLHATSAAAREVLLHPAIVRFFRLVFDQTPVGIQSLAFEYPSEQHLHQDHAYVRAGRIPSHLGAAWVALDPVGNRNGPVRLYPGSHRLPLFDFGAGRITYDGSAPLAPYEAYLRRACAGRAIHPVDFHARPGDVLLWHAALVHAGAPALDPDATRRSFVAHYASHESYPSDLQRFPDGRPARPIRMNGGLVYAIELPASRSARQVSRQSARTSPPTGDRSASPDAHR